MNKELKQASLIPSHIRNLRSQYKKGIIVETGAGCPVYNHLCQYPNTASKLVYKCESPNDWDYNKNIYNHESRAVSAETVKNIIENKKLELKEINKNEIIVDYILVNSIQIANDKDIAETHGWFGLYSLKHDEASYFHFTIPNYLNKSRKEDIKIIENIGIDILSIFKDNVYIDLYLNNDLSYDKKSIFSNLQLTSSGNVNNAVVFQKNGKITRLTEFLRSDFDNLVVFKGSFNPIHDQHVNLMKESKKLFSNVYGVFCISLFNRDTSKHQLDYDNLLKRIELINSLGYSVILDRHGYFKDSYKLIKSNPSFNNKQLHYITGADIFDRFIDDNINDNRNGIPVLDYDCTFIYADRNNIEINPGKMYRTIKLVIDSSEISSTAIRECLQYNDIEKLKQLVSDDLYTKYEKIWVK